MKITLYLLILFAFCVPCFSQKSVEDTQKQISASSDSKYFTVKYDKFKDITDLVVQVDLTPGKKAAFDFSNATLNLFINSRFEGNGISDKPKAHFLCAATSGKSLQLLKSRELNLIVDSIRFSLSEGNYDTNISLYSVAESLCWSLTDEQIQSILKAETFEFQLGEIESAIDKTKLGLFRQYQKLLQPKTDTPEVKADFTIANAIGKRKVFIETSDKESELQIAKELKKKNFEVVSELNSAEIIIRFGVEQTDVVNFGQMSTERRWGKISIYLLSNGREGLIFTKSKKPSTFGQLLHKQAGDMTEDFVKALLKAESSK